MTEQRIRRVPADPARAQRNRAAVRAIVARRDPVLALAVARALQAPRPARARTGR